MVPSWSSAALSRYLINTRRLRYVLKSLSRPLAASTQISDSECVAEPRYDDPARSQRNAALILRDALLATGMLPSQVKGRTPI